MVRVAVAGIAGRMGTRIAQIIGETEGLELRGGFDHPAHPRIGRKICEMVNGAAEGLIVRGSITEVLAEVDVVIDFTSAAASLNHLKAAAAAGKAMVVGSTGFTLEQLAEVENYAVKIPCVLSPNMSLGVNVLYKLVADAARLLGDGFDVEIIEAHHRLKKDAPSGTAIKLAKVAAEALDRNLDEVGVYARHGLIGERTNREIGIQTVRAGDIVGEHTILFGGMGERIEITHRAHSRDNFAMGAVRAAIWVAGRTPGLYDIADVLGIA